MKKSGWFAEWFDTEYYHILYKNRDDQEASGFIRRLVDVLGLEQGAKVADIACGKGRHSRVLAGLGFRVYGYDLSANSIEYARKHASGTEHFEIHDIRKPYNDSDFRAAFNLFTSFGYFDSREEDMEALGHIYQMLAPGGIFVQDYLNGPPACRSLPYKSTERLGGLEFEIEKTWNPPCIIKKISINGKKGPEHFQEKVKIYSAEEMEEMHTSCGFGNIRIFGDYNLGTYVAGQSPRMILISEKP